MTVEQKKTMRKSLSLVAVMFAVACAWWTIQGVEPNKLAATQIEPTNRAMFSSEIDTDWRYTKQGWRRIGGLYREEFAPIRTFESVHPFIWAATVILAVVATTVWASSEWELARFSRRKAEESNP